MSGWWSSASTVGSKIEKGYRDSTGTLSKERKIEDLCHDLAIYTMSLCLHTVMIWGRVAPAMVKS